MGDTLCIIGTDTDAGKTVITAALAKAASDAGKKVLILKPVHTGCVCSAPGEFAAPDAETWSEAAPGAITRVLESFGPACSPHLAARLAGRFLSAADLAQTLREEIASHQADAVFIEGAGGLFTPLGERETLADLLSLLDFPVLLAIPNRLGAVNHALLTIKACEAAGLFLAGFVMTEPSPAKNREEKAIREDNAAIIGQLGGVPRLASIRHLEGLGGNGAERALAWEKASEAVRPVLDAALEARFREERRRKNNFRESRCEKEMPGKSLSGDARSGNEPLLAFDRGHIWHPYTSALSPAPVWEAVKTRGARITVRGNRELVDGMASWWCAVHGYNHPVLMRALHSQAAKMPHVMFGGLTHEPAAELAKALLAIAPHGLEHVFFADSGSVSVEVALKMALQYQAAAGNTEKNHIMTVRGGYHGDTLWAMSVCDPVNGMHRLFEGVLPPRIFAPRPECRFDAPYDGSFFEAFEIVLARSADRVAAVILEPVVQGAGGMWFYHPHFLRDVKKACERHGCLLILDEIATGFGRTGKMFACEHAEIAPDIMCVGKALTGGVMSLATTLATKDVAEGVSRDGGALMHGPTFMGNPLACAVARASLSLLEADGWKEDVRRIEAKLAEGLLPCKGQSGVKDARVLGAIGVLEMEHPVNTEKLQRYFVAKGVWIRPFARLIYVMPPYIATNREIETLTRAMRGAVSEEIWR